MITTATVGSICSCRTWGSPAGCTTTKATASSRTSLRISACTGPDLSFACWFWDFDNDGHLDLYVNDYRARVAEVLASAMGVKIQGSSRPRLYRNLGRDGFRDVSQEVGLDRAMAPMGANFGDIDNDGYLDIYLGTGDMSYEGLDVNLLFRNVDGFRFEDVTDELRGPATFRRVTESPSPTTTPTAISTSLSSWGSDTRRSGLQRVVPEPRSWPGVAEGEARSAPRPTARLSAPRSVWT